MSYESLKVFSGSSRLTHEPIAAQRLQTKQKQQDRRPEVRSQKSEKKSCSEAARPRALLPASLWFIDRSSGSPALRRVDFLQQR